MKQTWVCAILIAFLAGGAAQAQSTAAAQAPPTTQPAEAPADSQAAHNATGASSAESGKSEWVFISTSYLWATSSKSQFTTRQGERLTAKDSFFEVLDDLKFALMGAAEARHGHLVLLGDLMYANLGSSAQGNLGPIPLSADVDIKTLLVTGLVGYRAIERGQMSLDLLAGARITAINADLEITGPLNTHEADFKKSHIGPVLASRFRLPLGGKWGATVYGDVGGFGIGSDLSWQARGAVEYELSKHWQLGGGWRHYYGRDTDNGFKLAQTLDGPIFFVNYRM